MATTPALMTVEEFQKLQDPPGAYYELRHGAAVARTRPKWNHTTIQERLRELVRSRNVTRGIVRVELPYRPVPEHELWVADVAYARRERCAGLAADVFRGAPDLVIEVLSPSNTVEEMDDKAPICLENGTLEFWVVNPERKAVTVYVNDGLRLHRTHEAVSVDRLFPGQPAIPVAEIFTEPEM